MRPDTDMAGPFNYFIGAVFGKEKLNYTSVIKSVNGHFNTATASYDEGSCLYSLQTNESDVTNSFVLHPIMNENIKPLQPFSKENIYLFSKYNVSRQLKAADVMSTFAEVYTTEVWILFVTFTLIFWILIRSHIKLMNTLKRKREKLRHDSLYRVLMQLFQVDYVSFINIRIISFVMTLFSFYIILFFTMSMKTDIVVVDEPVIINTYDDLLAMPRFKLIFPLMSDYYKRFESSEPGSKERKLWERSLEEAKGNRSKILFELTESDSVQIRKTLENIAFASTVETVATVTDFTKEIAKYALCLLKVIILHKQSTS